MLIDWFTVGAQALNFLILVWLLKRFLYKPILHAIDEREKRIANELADADAAKAEAMAERDAFQQKNETFEGQRAALLSKAIDEAQTQRQQLLEKARQAAEELSVKRQETMENEARELNQALSHRAQAEVFAITRKTLADLASTSLEEQLVEVFLRRFRAMEDQAKEGFAEALRNLSVPAIVRSAYQLPAQQQEQIQKMLNEMCSADIRIRFETAPELISGIELSTGGHKVAWSIADYLVSLQQGVDEMLRIEKRPGAKVEPHNEQTTIAPQDS